MQLTVNPLHRRRGTIDIDEFQKALQMKNITATGSDVSNQDLCMVFEAMDADRSGKIDYGEFISFLNKPEDFAKRQLKEQQRRKKSERRERAPNFVLKEDQRKRIRAK